MLSFLHACRRYATALLQTDSERAAHTYCAAAQQAPLEVERVVDCCMRLEEALCWCLTLEALHLSLASSIAQM